MKPPVSAMPLASALPQNGRRGRARDAFPREISEKKKKPRVKMPLITVANSPDKRPRWQGLERWKTNMRISLVCLP